MTRLSHVVLFAFSATALAAPSIDGRAIVVGVSSVRSSSDIYLTVKDKATSELLASSDSPNLSTGALTVSADVDKSTGAGTLIIDGKSYMIHEPFLEVSPALIRVITGARLYNENEFFVSCDATIPTSIRLSARAQPPAPSVLGSGTPALLPGIFETMLTGGGPAPEFEGNLTHPAGSLEVLDKRQGSCGVWTSNTYKVGDGNPHQNFYLKQLSQNINCGAAAECAVGESSSISYTIGWSASAEAFEWISGGFDVSVSWETGKNYECGATTGQTLCLWYNTAHTAYTVQNARLNQCTGSEDVGGSYVMFSPNAANQGGGYYCVVGACRNQGDGYWDYNGRAGGP